MPSPPDDGARGGVTPDQDGVTGRGVGNGICVPPSPRHLDQSDALISWADGGRGEEKIFLAGTGAGKRPIFAPPGVPGGVTASRRRRGSHAHSTRWARMACQRAFHLL